MKNTLITGGTSGIGNATAQRCKDQGDSVIITGSRESFATEKYIQHNQITDTTEKLLEKISMYTKKLDRVFLNAGIFVPDIAKDAEIQKMEKINYTSTLEILQALEGNKMILPETKVLINASIQIENPKKYSLAYAESKKKLREAAVAFAKEKDIDIAAVGLSAVQGTNILEQGITLYVKEGIFANEDAFKAAIQITPMDKVIALIASIYNGERSDSRNKLLKVA